MHSEFYDFESDEARLRFEFESSSERKKVKKSVIFSSITDNDFFNLALVDMLPNGEFSDLSITNNSDLDKTLATVVKCLFHFFSLYPRAVVYFTGSTPTRTRLYRIAITKELSEVRKYFEIYGVTDISKEHFVPDRNYDAYLIELKNH